MKPQTIDLLLDCYIKERIPNAKEILEESTNDVSVLKGRSHSFSFSPRPPSPPHVVESFTEESMKDLDASMLRRRFHTFSYAPTPPSVQYVLQSSPEGVPSTQGLDEPIFLASQDAIDGLGNEERQKCKAVAKKLVKIADEFQEHHMTSLRDRGLKSFLDEYEKGYTSEERNTMERIYSGGVSQGVSRIASVLANCFTPQTFQAAIRFLSGQNDNDAQQLAIILELSTHVVRVMGGRVLDTIRPVVFENFQHLSDLEDL